jgi:integrase
MLGIPSSTYYDWYAHWNDGGVDALSDRSPQPRSAWNRIPDKVREDVLDFALEHEDLIRLRWSDYDGEAISLLQSKGKVRVSVPCSAALRVMLDGTPRQCAYILARGDGRPWFTAKDDKALAKAYCAYGGGQPLSQAI